MSSLYEKSFIVGFSFSTSISIFVSLESSNSTPFDKITFSIFISCFPLTSYPANVTVYLSVPVFLVTLYGFPFIITSSGIKIDALVLEKLKIISSFLLKYIVSLFLFAVFKLLTCNL